MASPPDIVLIVLDTARQDRMSPYGYHRQTTPRLAAFAEDAVVYENAYSTSSWTAPSHASMFTGNYPARHRTTQEHWDLQNENYTLAERLGEAGYDTYGVVGNGMVSRKRGFAQGFDKYVEAYKRARRQAEKKGKRGKGRLKAMHPADPVSAQTVAQFLGKRESQAPFFLFVNLIGPHSPYDSCGQSCGTWASAAEDRPVANDWAQVYAGEVTHSEDALRHLSDLYDDELLEADRHLGAILDTIKKHGRPDNTLIMVTSDHGEHFGEHGHVDHVFSLHEPVVRVPLVVRFPGRARKGRVEAPVQLVDILPTALAAAKIAVEEEIQGHDLHTDPPADRSVFLEYATPVQAFQRFEGIADPKTLARLKPFRQSLRAVIDGPDKLHQYSEGSRELYDLAQDPQELRDLFGNGDKAQKTVAALEEKSASLLERYRQGALPEPEQGASAVDEETRAVLEALGYVDK